MSREIIASIEAEYRRYEALGEAAFGQLNAAQLSHAPAEANSVATIVWHVSGNLESRFTDFLTSDGEKPWRNRESEFEPRHGVSRVDVSAKWKRGWATLFATLESLNDADLTASVKIRGVPLTVHEALHRSLAHASYHVGQIVFVGKSILGSSWRSLSIPPGGSEAYNRDPSLEKASDFVAAFRKPDA